MVAVQQTECVSRDWSADVKQENLADVKQKPDDVCEFVTAQHFLVLQGGAEKSGT